MTTFSQLVDTVIAESRRADMRPEIESYVNQTIRDVHFNDQNSNLVLFDDNRREAMLYASSEETFVWPVPNPQTFAKLEAIYCPYVGDYAIERKPNQVHTRENLHNRPTFYRTGQAFALSGFGGLNAPVQLSWFAYPRRLKWYTPQLRSVNWNQDEQEFEYTPPLPTEELKEAALDLNTNWLLQRWQDLIHEGTRAKLYKKLADEVRNRNAYASFESSRKAMVAAESFESGVILSR